MAIEYAPRNIGRHSMLDSMARPLNGWHQEPNLPRNGGHYPREQYLGSQPQPPRLPSMASMISTATHPGPGRDSYHSRPGYYSDYATPSPVGQTPPHLPLTSNEPHPHPHPYPHPYSRRHGDVRLSPALSSVASDRSDEYQDMIRLRQSTRDYAPEQARGYLTQPRPRRETSHQDRQSMALFGKLVPAYSGHQGTHPPRPPSQQQPQTPPTPQPSASPRQETKSMSISNLLSDGSGGERPTASAAPAPAPASAPASAPAPAPASASASASAPAPAPTSAPATRLRPAQLPGQSEYRIAMRQQPFAARSCGFGERDRRVIDPPPIIQLTIEDPEASAEEVSRKLRHQCMVVHCSIWDESGTRDMSSMPEDFRQQRRLMGTLVSSPFVGRDEHGAEGCFFCFPDLSCRTPGSFRLRFSLVVLDPLNMRLGARTTVAAYATSEPFQVFNAKDFPGMKASTPLTKKLKEQGCLISIKKGNDKAGNTHSRDDSGDDEDDEDGGDSGEPKSRRRKRQKKNA